MRYTECTSLPSPRPRPPTPFCPNDLSTSSLSLRLPLVFVLLLLLLLPGPLPRRVLTPFCNFNLIFAHRYRSEQTAIIRADLIRPRCLSACAYFFRPFSHFRKRPRVAPFLCTITRKGVRTVATHFDATRRVFIFSVSLFPPPLPPSLLLSFSLSSVMWVQ